MTANDPAESLPVVTIYFDTLDHPDQYVARRWWVKPGGALEAEEQVLLIANTLEAVRMALPPGMIRVPRAPEDDQVILETWV